MVLFYVSVVEFGCVLTYYDFFLLLFAFMVSDLIQPIIVFVVKKLIFYLTTFVNTELSCLYPRIYKHKLINEKVNKASINESTLR